MANEKKSVIEKEPFISKKKEEKKITFLPLFSLLKNSFNASVSSALAAEISLSLLAKGYAV